MMHKSPAAAYLTVAALALVTIIGANLTQTAKTGNIAIAQAMFASDFPVAQQSLDGEQIADHDAASKANNLY
jgi:hypothetical protein